MINKDIQKKRSSENEKTTPVRPIFNPLNANPTKWSIKLKQFVGCWLLPTNCLSVFDHCEELALKGLKKMTEQK